MAAPASPPSSTSRHDSFGGCLTNLTWLVVCPGALGLTAMGIGAGGNPGWRWLDLVYGGVMLVALGARFLEARWGAGRPETGSGPEPMAAWRRYAVRFAATAGGVLVAAHAVAWIVGR